MHRIILCLAGVTLAAPIYLAPLFADSSGPDFNPIVKIKGAGARYLQKIEIMNPYGRDYDYGTVLTYESDGTIQIDLGLGEWVSKVNLRPASSASVEFRVEQQYETSLTLMDEGPHMDLRNWKHHVSAWEPLEQRSGLSFALKDVDVKEFPKVEGSEIVEATIVESKRWKAQGYPGSDRWIAAAKKCESATTYPCGVSVSKVRLKISVKESGEWKPIQIVELVLPMGC